MSLSPPTRPVNNPARWGGRVIFRSTEETSECSYTSSRSCRSFAVTVVLVFCTNCTLSDERGDKYRRSLGGAPWVQTPDRTSREFILTLDASPKSDSLVLETHNGDNPPIELEKFQAFYPATRVLFKAQPADELLLYYGNPHVGSPRYDLSLVAGKLLVADQAEAALATEEQLKKSWGEGHRPGKGGVVFWGILAVVVTVLLIIISRLLPQSPQPK